MPPPNTTSATATLIPSLPYDVTQTDIFDAGTNYTVWYKVICPTGVRNMGAFGWSGTDWPNYKPLTLVYKGVGLDEIAFGISGNATPFQFPVEAGETYFLELRSNGSTVGPSQVRLRVYAHQPLEVNTGNIVIHDDTGPLPVAILSSTTDYLVRNFVNDMPGGESASVLPDGTMAFEDDLSAGVELKLYDKNFQQTHAVSLGPVGRNLSYIQRNADGTKFWALYYHSQFVPAARSIAPDSSLGPELLLPDPRTVGAVYPHLLAADSGDHVLYYTQHAVAVPIKRWNVDTNTAMADLASAIPNNQPAEMFVLADGTLLVASYDTSATATVVRRYNAAGTVVTTHTFPTIGSGLTHVTYGLDNPASYWIWEQPSSSTPDGLSKFHHVRASDGSILQTILGMQFEGGTSEEYPTTADPTAWFGHSFSCTFFIATQGVEPEPPPPPESYHLEERLIRRLRRAPHVAQENVRVFYRKFELDLERGVGLASGQGADPLVLLRLSRDGGQTWGEPQTMAAGRLGAYTERVIARRLGQARDTVFEVTVSDPVAWSLVQAWLDLEAGTS